MNSYNLCDEKWISVRYLDGHFEKVGIKQALQDAKQIKNLLPPEFRGDRVDFYDFLLVKLLSTIVMSAYYKERTGFAARNLDYLDGLKLGCYTGAVSDYLEEFHDRFDLFSEEHPFLQNILLKDKLLDADLSNLNYLTWNPIAPGMNNRLFGKCRSIDCTQTEPIKQYQICAEELAYILLYTATVATFPAATVSKEKSLGAKDYLFVCIEGETLLDTILSNIVPLKQSSRPLEDYEKEDKPVWECHNIREMTEYSRDIISKNRLALSFYPGISILAAHPDNDGYIKSIVRCELKDKTEYKVGLDDSETALLAGIVHDPSTIVVWNKDKSSTLKLSNNMTAMELCISATAHVGPECACALLDNIENRTAKRVKLHYRKVKQVSLTALGVIDGYNIKTWIQLLDEEKRKSAIAYQSMYSFLNDLLSKHLKHLFISSMGRNTGASTIKDAKHEFSEWVERDFFGDFTRELSESPDSAYQDAVLRMKNAVIRIYEKCSADSFDLLKIAKEKKELLLNINRKTRRIVKNARAKEI